MNSAETSPLVIVINSKKAFEYYRDRPLSRKQINDLEKAGHKLNQGLRIGREFIQSPTDADKALFIARQLVFAIQHDDDGRIAFLCALLACRYPQLKQLKISIREDQVSIELINDKTFVDQAPVRFISKKDLNQN